MTLFIHILAGSLAIVAGYIALFARKGARVHRTFGALFVGAMLTMALAGMAIAAARGVAPAINIPMGVLASYLVVSAWASVQKPGPGIRRLQIACLAVALGVGLVEVGLGLDAIVRGGASDGMPAPAFLLFGSIPLLAATGDLKVVRSGNLQGTARLVRHLWRMSLALVIAAGSFFLGQSDEFPEAMRIMPLLALPMLVALAAMIYWPWRLRTRGRRAPQAG